MKKNVSGLFAPDKRVLRAGVSGVFSRGSPHILIGPSHMSRNNLERDVKLNKNYFNKKILLAC